MSTETFQTSKAAYEWCVAEGLISRRVAEVLAVLNERGPMNQTMAHQAIQRITGNVTLEKYSISPRFAVLERMGLIKGIGRQRCPITSRATVFFEPTRSRPTCTEAEAMSRASRRETLAALKEKVRELEKERDQLAELLHMRSAGFQERERRIKAAPLEVQTSLL